MYYDLYVGDGTMRRFLATDMCGALGSLVSITDARGVTSMPADMGIDIVYDSNGVRQFLTPSHLADVTLTADFSGYDKWESWGFAMTNRVEGFDGLTNITEWTYYTSGNGKGHASEFQDLQYSKTPSSESNGLEL